MRQGESIEINTEPPQPLSKKSSLFSKSQKLLKVLFFILLETTVITISFFLGIYIGKNQISNPQSITSYISPFPSPITVNSIPANSTNSAVSSENMKWNTYIGQIYTFTYPHDWNNETKRSSKEVVLISKEKTMEFTIETKTTEYGTECLMPSTNQTIDIIFNGQKKTVDINKGFSDEICSNEGYREVSFGENHENEFYIFSFSYREDNEILALETLSQIMFSFKFID